MNTNTNRTEVVTEHAHTYRNTCDILTSQRPVTVTITVTVTVTDVGCGRKINHP